MGRPKDLVERHLFGAYAYRAVQHLANASAQTGLDVTFGEHALELLADAPIVARQNTCRTAEQNKLRLMLAALLGEHRTQPVLHCQRYFDPARPGAHDADARLTTRG